MNELDTIFTHAVPNASVLRDGAPYPLILFSHGYLGSHPLDFTVFCEEIASHGYVVASIAHTYYATEVKFPDGRVITPPEALLAKQSAPDHAVQALWAADVQCVLDYLIKVNVDERDQFYHLLDVKRVGIVGHSMGGSTAYRLCLNDPRFKAGVSLDASPWSQDKPVEELKTPFLFIFAEQTVKDINKSDEELAREYGVAVEMVAGFRSISQQRIREDIVIPETAHGSFRDFMLIKEIPLYKKNKDIFNFEVHCGKADEWKTIQFINQKIIDFFKKNLI